MGILDTGIKLVRNVDRYNFGRGSIRELRQLLESRRRGPTDKRDKSVVFLIDSFFETHTELVRHLPVQQSDLVLFVNTSEEPTTDGIDKTTQRIREKGHDKPCVIVGIGGGVTLDTAKAVSNLLTNGGRAAQYQGWDLVKRPGIYKVGIPTISGTGAEATRTCVMTNPANGLKLGMNSDFTVFDHVIMDSDLTATVDRNQYFFTGMDAYIHSIESLSGGYRNAIGDAYARETVRLCREVFLSEDMMAAENREKLMVASYLGGCAIATSYVGVVHPFSAGLSVVLGLHHCVANCITMRAMEGFYRREYDEFWKMAERQKVRVPSGVCHDLSGDKRQALFDATVIHEKPLTNALGDEFRSVLTFEKVMALFERM
jgi:3-deoxy-alpha-D-manno-octulosonate 8-oxidase